MMIFECCQRFRFARTPCPRCRASPLTERVDHGNGWVWALKVDCRMQSWLHRALGCFFVLQHPPDGNHYVVGMTCQIRSMAWQGQQNLDSIQPLPFAEWAPVFSINRVRDSVVGIEKVCTISMETRTRTLASLLLGLWLNLLRNSGITSAAVSTVSTFGSCENKHQFLSSPSSRLRWNAYHRRKIEIDSS